MDVGYINRGPILGIDRAAPFKLRPYLNRSSPSRCAFRLVILAEPISGHTGEVAGTD